MSNEITNRSDMTKRLFTFFMSSIVLFSLLQPARPHTVDGTENHNVSIPDESLRAAIETQLAKSPGDDITAEEIQTMTQLVKASLDIRDLTGLEHATKLTRLALLQTSSSLAQLDARPRLNLETLGGLTDLKELTLQYVLISDMTPLTNLINLRSLALLHTHRISKIPDLSKLTELVHLRFETSSITDITGISGLTNLRQLTLLNNPNLSDISPVANLRNLEILRLDNNPNITAESLSAVLPFFSTEVDQEVIDEYPNVSINSGQLGFSSTNISDLSVLDKLPNIFLFALYVRSLGTRSSGKTFLLLKDITPLVDLMNNGKIINQKTSIYLSSNYGLDYESFYEDLPALLAGSRYVEYGQPVPILEREFPKGTSYTGLPRTSYTFKVRAVNKSFIQNRQFSEVPVTFTVTTPDGNNETMDPVKTGPDGLASVTITLGNLGETHTVTAVVPANRPTMEIQHEELRVEFTVTADRTIESPPVLDPSDVAMDRVVFNELYNATDDTNDWVELKNISDVPVSLKDWEISIVSKHTRGNPHRADVDIVAFPDYTLPSGGILLITNAPPSETDLVPGQDITKADSKPTVLQRYFVAPEMQLPAHRYLLILRSETDKNGKPEAFEDVAGTYLHQNFHEIVGTESGGDRIYATHVWPLQVSNPGSVAALTENQAWQRVSVSDRGYDPEAWAETGYQQGLGYKPQAARETSLGTPGYPNPMVGRGPVQAAASTDTQDAVAAGSISFSELMYTSRGGLHSLPQWIELYNNSNSEAINLKGWTFAVEVRDTDGTHRSGKMKLHDLSILPKQTALMVTWSGRNSGHFPEARVYHIFRHNDTFEQDINRNRVLSPSGFLLRLLDRDNRLVDTAGNLDGDQKTTDAPAWEFPSGEAGTGVRTSLVRRYTDGVAVDGKHPMSWHRAATRVREVQTYWGRETDIGTPGYREGGILPVGLSSLRSERSETGEVIITWTTESETQNVGFNVLRSRTAYGTFVKINATLIPGAGTTSERQTYTYPDRSAAREVAYYYRLEDVSVSGARQRLATVRMKGHVSGVGKRVQQWGALKVMEQ